MKNKVLKYKVKKISILFSGKSFNDYRMSCDIGKKLEPTYQEGSMCLCIEFSPL